MIDLTNNLILTFLHSQGKLYYWNSIYFWNVGQKEIRMKKESFDIFLGVPKLDIVGLFLYIRESRIKNTKGLIISRPYYVPGTVLNATTSFTSLHLIAEKLKT